MKTCIKVGFSVQVEQVIDGKTTGVFEEVITERTYYADKLREYTNTQTSQRVLTDIHLSNRFSIIADPWARDNYSSIVYLTYMGTRWTVDSIEVGEHPRLILSISSPYHGPTIQLIEPEGG